MYIGKTVDTIEERFKEHIHDSKKARTEKRPLYRAMRKYGIEHFKIELVEECDYKVLSEREQYWIDYYDTYYNGYNATKGGDGSLLYDADEIIKKYNEGMLVKEIANEFGCERTIIAKYLKRAGINPFENYGKRLEQIYPSIIMCNKETDEILYIFVSCTDAARWLLENDYSHGSLSHTQCTISRAVKGKRKSAYGFIWRVNPNWQGAGLENQE